MVGVELAENPPLPQVPLLFVPSPLELFARICHNWQAAHALFPMPQSGPSEMSR